MERRYEAYKTHVVKPFFREHFARLDRQIVLVDALAASMPAPHAVRDLETALTEILAAFRPGREQLAHRPVLAPRIDRILFAATKADHLHHDSHDRLEAILRRLADRAIARANFAGAAVDVRRHRLGPGDARGNVKQGRATLPVDHRHADGRRERRRRDL